MDYIIYFVITIAILVFVHEFGHFAAAKICKMRADIFAIGFGKRLFGWNKINGFTWGNLPEDFDGLGHTDYRLCLLPLGGYVKIAGMVDESFDTEFADAEPQPYEFRSKPTYMKLFVITAGVLMNLLLTLTIFWGTNFFHDKVIYKTTEVGLVVKDSPAQMAGFKTNDKILTINGKQVNNWDEVLNQFFVDNMGKDIAVKISRNNKDTSFTVTSAFISDHSKEGIFIYPGNTKPLISEVVDNSPALTAGIKAGDVFLKIDGVPMQNREEVVKVISSNPEKKLDVAILRGNDTVQVAVTPGADGKIGIAIGDTYSGEVEYQAYGVIGSFEQSVKNIGQYTVLTFTMIKNVVRGKVAFNQAFGGPVKIAQYAAKSADSGMQSFLSFLAMLSLSLAIINILPFPVLDGGHFVIILIEGLFRKELPIKIKVAIQNAGFVLLLLLMAFIIYSDIISL